MSSFNYWGNGVSTKAEIEDALFEAIAELEQRLNFQTSREEQKGIVESYFESFDVEELKEANDGFLSFMHPQSFVIGSMYELKLARVANEKAFKNGSAF